MSSGRSNRKLANVKLTRRFHYQYMAMWLIITITLLAILIEKVGLMLGYGHWQPG